MRRGEQFADRLPHLGIEIVLEFRRQDFNLLPAGSAQHAFESF